MIEPSRLTAADIGRFVIYLPSRTKGRIKSWNHEFVFVVYSPDGNWDRFEDYTAAATRPEDLVWG
jgi:hypothetical protein